jgi:hypothetical protein
MRHAIVNKDNVVVNIVIWDGREWLPPKNHSVIQSDVACIGDTYDGLKNIFIKKSNTDKI